MSFEILLAIDNNLRAIMDTGCSRALAGSNWIRFGYPKKIRNKYRSFQVVQLSNLEMAAYTRAKPSGSSQSTLEVLGKE